MSLNVDLIRERFDDILASVARLEELQGLSLEAFLADQDAQDIASYRLLQAIEAALQVCYHVAAQRLRRVPGQYAECFAILAEAGLLDAELSRNLQHMARFRNLLVHVYWKVDYRTVHALLQDRLADLRAFVQAIGELL
jgi:uncharacterized protein YutE (UPF0331/DUF86 family)